MSVPILFFSPRFLAPFFLAPLFSPLFFSPRFLTVGRCGQERPAETAQEGERRALGPKAQPLRRPNGLDRDNLPTSRAAYVQGWPRPFGRDSCRRGLVECPAKPGPHADSGCMASAFACVHLREGGQAGGAR